MTEIFLNQNESGGSSVNVRVITSGASVQMLPGDYALLINKTVGSPTTVLLAAPKLGRPAVIHDMKGDAATNNITIDAGSGNLINGAQTLVLPANYASTWLIGESDSQWGTII